MTKGNLKRVVCRTTEPGLANRETDSGTSLMTIALLSAALGGESSPTANAVVLPVPVALSEKQTAVADPGRDREQPGIGVLPARHHGDVLPDRLCNPSDMIPIDRDEVGVLVSAFAEYWQWDCSPVGWLSALLGGQVLVIALPGLLRAMV